MQLDEIASVYCHRHAKETTHKSPSTVVTERTVIAGLMLAPIVAICKTTQCFERSADAMHDEEWEVSAAGIYLSDSFMFSVKILANANCDCNMLRWDASFFTYLHTWQLIFPTGLFSYYDSSWSAAVFTWIESVSTCIYLIHVSEVDTSRLIWIICACGYMPQESLYELRYAGSYPCAITIAAGAGWNDENTRALLGIWGSADVQRQLDGIVHNKTIYEKITAALHNVTWQQCKTNMVQRYKKVCWKMWLQNNCRCREQDFVLIRWGTAIMHRNRQEDMPVLRRAGRYTYCVPGQPPAHSSLWQWWTDTEQNCFIQSRMCMSLYNLPGPYIFLLPCYELHTSSSLNRMTTLTFVCRPSITHLSLPLIDPERAWCSPLAIHHYGPSRCWWDLIFAVICSMYSELGGYSLNFANPYFKTTDRKSSKRERTWVLIPIHQIYHKRRSSRHKTGQESSSRWQLNQWDYCLCAARPKRKRLSKRRSDWWYCSLCEGLKLPPLSNQ